MISPIFGEDQKAETNVGQKSLENQLQRNSISMIRYSLLVAFVFLRFLSPSNQFVGICEQNPHRLRESGPLYVVFQSVSLNLVKK